MPRKVINYDNTIIYKIVCRDLSKKDTYVGHTTNFTQRKARHKSNSIDKNYFGNRLYDFIRSNGGWENFDMIEIQKYKCKDFYEACKYERQWIETLNSRLNMVCPLRTEDEKRKLKKMKVLDFLKSIKSEIELLEEEFNKLYG